MFLDDCVVDNVGADHDLYRKYSGISGRSFGRGGQRRESYCVEPQERTIHHDQYEFVGRLHVGSAGRPETTSFGSRRKGFKTAELPLTVQVGVTTAGSVRLQVGQADQVVEVQGSALQVNTEQATVQGVLSAQQIDTLPINGRNFLDLAQLEPGVQIQDGGTFDPTKNGFSSISFGGRYGRTARIEVDGIDISDETVGTTTQNIPAGAISEFQIGQSSLDLSTELTSSGSVNVVTRSGTNDWHGDAFYLFRDSSLAAKLPGTTSSPFQRNQFGGRLGGPVIKDKLILLRDRGARETGSVGSCAA